MAIKKMAMMIYNIVQRFAVWDGVQTWNPSGYTTGDTTGLYVKVGSPYHDRQGNSYTHNIVVDGNSIARGALAGVSGISEAVVDAGLTQWDVINMARDGWSTPDLTAKTTNDIGLLYEAGLGADNNIIIFFEGGNDLANTLNSTSTFNNIQAYCEAVKLLGYGKVIVGTLLPRHYSNAGTKDAYNTARMAVNTSIRNALIAEAAWLDGVADVGADATIGNIANVQNTTYFSDGIHLTVTGQGILKTYFTDALTDVL